MRIISWLRWLIPATGTATTAVILASLFTLPLRAAAPDTRTLPQNPSSQPTDPPPKPALPLPLQADSQATAAHRPTIDTAPNGVPLVNIATPNRAGLSHNQYQQFNVGTVGVILNNSQAPLSRSQLGGLVQGNGQLSQSGPARVILNEVTSTHRSVLAGALEVHGAAADVVVANPNGIACQGSGFINTPRVTLTTGRPMVGAEGALTGLQVEGGTIQIGKQGVAVSQAQVFELISRRVTVAGPVQAGSALKVVAGRNHYTYPSGQVKPCKPKKSADQPALAIDSTLLGGMYAGRITVIATEAGTGVRMPSRMAANAQDMTLTTDGKLVLNSAVAQRTLHAQSVNDTVTVQGTVYSQQTVKLQGKTGVMVADHALVAGQRDVNLQGQTVTVDQQASVAAGMTAQGKLHTTGQLNVQATILQADAGQLAAGEQLTVTAEHIDLTKTTDAVTDNVYSGGAVTFNTQRLSGGQVTAQRSLTLESPQDLHLNSQLHGQYTVLQAAGSLTNDELIVGHHSLALTAATLNNAGRLGSTQGDLHINLSGHLNNSGLLYSGQASHYRLDGTLSNNADLLAKTDLTVQGHTTAWAQGLINTSGTIEAVGNLHLQAHQLQQQRQQLTFDTSQTGPHTVTTQDRQRRAGSDIITTTTITTDHIRDTSPAAQLLAGNHLTLTADQITNDYSHIVAHGDITLNAASVTDTGRDLLETTHQHTVRHHYQKVIERSWFGLVEKDKTRRWTTTNQQTTSRTVDAIYGTLQAGGTLQGTVTGYLNNQALRQGVEQIGLTSGQHGSLPTTLTRPCTTLASTFAGLLNRLAALTLEPTTDHSSYRIETRPAYIDLQQLLGSDYFLHRVGHYQPEHLAKRLSSTLETRLIGAQHLELTGQAITDQHIQALYDNALQAHQKGQLTVGTALTQAQQQNLTDNLLWLEPHTVQGQTVLVPRLYLTASAIDPAHLASGRIQARRTVLNSASLTNNGHLSSSDDLTLTTTDSLTNQGGQLSAGGNLHIQAPTVINRSGTIKGHNLSVQAHHLQHDTVKTRDHDAHGYRDRSHDRARIEASNHLQLTTTGTLTATGATLMRWQVPGRLSMRPSTT